MKRTKEKFPISSGCPVFIRMKRSVLNADLMECLEDSQKLNWSSNYQFKKADGSYAHIEENGYIIRDENGKATRMVGAMRDVSAEQKSRRRNESPAKRTGKAPENPICYE